MENFAKQPDNDKQDIFRECANRRGGLREIIIEKDFWVCWVLKQIYASPKLAPYMTFKGGTSLSKVYRLIERFSEDIDLTIHRDAPYIRDIKNPMEENISRKERERRIKSLKQTTQYFIACVALPELEQACQNSLQPATNWDLVLDPADPDQQTVLFYYPKVCNDNTSYIKPTIRLEFGARGDTQPCEKKHICPYVVEDFPEFFTQSTVEVTTLAAERSFWEKITILHALHHGSKLHDRMSRHYYDTVMMANKGLTQAALNAPRLLDQVVQNKTLLFRDSKASYNTAKLGSLKIVPTNEIRQILQKDYQAMQEMFMTQAPDFEAMMQDLLILEKQINE